MAWMDDNTLLLRWKYNEGTLICDAPHGQYKIAHGEFYKASFNNEGLGEFQSVRGAVNAANTHFTEIMERLAATAS